MFELIDAYPVEAWSLVAFAWIVGITLIILFFKGADNPDED